MPVYHYKCSNCEFDDEVYHSIKEPIRTICELCKKETLSVVIDGAFYGAVREIKTLGQLAEHNSKKMGKEQVELRMEADGTKDILKSHQKRERLNKIANLTPEKREKYIMEGKL